MTITSMISHCIALLFCLFAVPVFYAQHSAEVREVPLCGDEIYFEMVLTTWHTEPVTALESFPFRSKINDKTDKSNLDKDILATCEEYAVVNCEDIAQVIHDRYDKFLSKLVDDERNDIEPQRNCAKIKTVDYGYSQHRRSGKSLTVTKAPLTFITADGTLSPPEPIAPKTASEVTTIVSGYWRVKNKYTEADGVYPHEEWMQNSLSLHMPYLFFTDPDRADLVRRCRGSLPTMIALRNMSEFKAYGNYDPSWVHELHVPTPELATIWLEKINLLYLATLITKSTFYAWVDAGLGTFRTIKMPQEEWSLEVLQSLPPLRLSYARASGTYHSFAAGVMIARKEVIHIVHSLFYAEFDRCRREVRDWRCGSEQYILSNIRDQNPHLFHAMSYEYSDISHLWANRYPFNKSKK